MNQKTKWDCFYSSKEREPFLHLSDTQLKNVLLEFPNAKSALDIGCGEGQLMVQLEKAGLSTTGIDVSPVCLGEATKHVKGKLVEADFEQFEFAKDSKFDLIFAKFIIAFINHPESFFEKIISLLNRRGGLILLTPVSAVPLTNSDSDEVFVSQNVIDLLPRFFEKIDEEILYSEESRKLSLYVCRRPIEGVQR